MQPLINHLLTLNPLSKPCALESRGSLRYNYGEASTPIQYVKAKQEKQSGERCVSWSKKANKWLVTRQLAIGRFNLGYFDTVAEGVVVRDKFMQLVADGMPEDEAQLIVNPNLKRIIKHEY